MALPKINHALYEHNLVGMGKKIQYRPFTNSEQKVLLLAKEAKGSEDERKTVLGAVKQIVNACTVGKLDAAEISTFDLEDLFMRIRAKSVGELLTVRYCYNYKDEDDRPKSRFIDVEINIDDIKVVTKENHEKKIMITDKIGVMMRYPNFGMMEYTTNSEELAIACIDYIFDENEIYPSNAESKEDMLAFYDDIDTSGLIKIKNFFDTMPKLTHTIEIEVEPGKKETIKFEGLEDFFT